MEKRVWHVKWRLNRSVVGYGRIECKSTPDSTSAVRKKVVTTWIAFSAGGGARAYINRSNSNRLHRPWTLQWPLLIRASRYRSRVHIGKLCDRFCDCAKAQQQKIF